VILSGLPWGWLGLEYNHDTGVFTDLNTNLEIEVSPDWAISQTMTEPSGSGCVKYSLASIKNGWEIESCGADAYALCAAPLRTGEKSISRGKLKKLYVYYRNFAVAVDMCC